MLSTTHSGDFTSKHFLVAWTLGNPLNVKGALISRDHDIFSNCRSQKVIA
jgi:hypothetical protein